MTAMNCIVDAGVNDMPSTRSTSTAFLLAILLLAAASTVTAYAQASPSSVPPEGALSEAGPTTDRLGCVLHGHIYTCNFGAFHHAFHRAKTISVEASPRDRAALSQLQELVGQLNRSVAPEGQGDLIFSVLPIDNGAILVGPADLDLATLRIYERGPEGGHGELVWSETYRGQADHPWPSTVHALLMQFRDRMKMRKQ
jgi:hypothetical protein